MGNGQSIRARHATPFRYHRISPSNSLNQPLLDDDSQKAALEKENRDLRSALSRQESKLQSKLQATEAQGRNNTSLEREVNEMKSQVSKLKSERQLDKAHKFKQEEAIEKLKRSNAAFEDKVKKQLSITSTISEMKATTNSSDSQVLSVAVVPQIETADHVVEIASTENDIAACLVVLIFLVSILIGISL
ncbi:hypothetical protein FH972_000013 [Carpinus fangiana]|uniref:Uncharacterized protein n=1 Tax=Carpinus fangiana TaxID=176857 RepID=A0A5N6Q7U4_9ROSI|nr:hypothetical protein FH972_000013 [Carpinus fangiana]